MQRYYHQRAAEYERVYHRPHRQPDLRALEAWLAESFRGRRVLEVAAGTGWWTLHGARHAADWLATDAEAAPWSVAQAKALPPAVRFAPLDAYAIDSARVLDGQVFDAAFAGCWWSHVPRARLSGFLQSLQRRLQPGALVVMLDHRYVEGDSTPLARRDGDGNTYQWRTLEDGTRHEVLKNFPEPAEAIAAAGPDVHDAHWTALRHYWLLSWRTGPAAPA
jgi:demethylmenaquinone methyltransferase/2-methoxy-6-polyprenyl-1,4-benzoquinol methylase